MRNSLFSRVAYSSLNYFLPLASEKQATCIRTTFHKQLAFDKVDLLLLESDMNRRATLLNHLGGRSPDGTGQAGRIAPRWSNCAASAVRRVIDDWPTGKHWKKLVDLSRSPPAWERMEADLIVLLPDSLHYSNALGVLRYLCDKLRTLGSDRDRTCACRSFTRTLNKKARSLGRALEAPAPPVATPRGTVNDWRSADPSKDRRRDSSRCKATQGAVRAWDIGQCAGALAPQRARRRMEVECPRVAGRQAREFARRLVNNKSLATLTANSYDHWMWADGEHFSVEEAARACGVPDGSPLHLALDRLTPIQAVSALGDGLHISVARHIVEQALVGLPRSASRPVTYGSAFSGIDGIAAALHAASSGNMRHEFAAEQHPRTRSALLAAWGPLGLTEASALTDARHLGSAGLPPVDLFSCTPSCKPFSKANEAWTHQARAEVLADLHTALHYVRTHRPARVIIENVTSPCVVAGVGTIVGALKDYDFIRYELCPFVHFGIPTRRLRSYWVGALRVVPTP